MKIGVNTYVIITTSRISILNDVQYFPLTFYPLRGNSHLHIPESYCFVYMTAAKIIFVQSENNKNIQNV